MLSVVTRWCVRFHHEVAGIIKGPDRPVVEDAEITAYLGKRSIATYRGNIH